MLTSARWMNDYLDPPASPQEQAELLTGAGFPIESSEPLDDGDARQDFEMTSNRGDCACHLGLAREIVAVSGRRLVAPSTAPPAPTGPAAAELVRVINHDYRRCPLYTARIIRGVRIAPSPDWLQQRLRARGDVPRNNVVDATNFVLFELGQPTHVFDLAKLRGGEINIRLARPGERFLPIGEEARPVTLTADDLVIADAERPVALAGVKGGAETAVAHATTDLLLEAATFDVVSVRNTSRRHGISSDSSYRFERGVHPAQIDTAAGRLAALIIDLAGGELCGGSVVDGAPIEPLRQVTMRTARCRQLLGVAIEDGEMVEALRRLGFEPVLDGGAIRCTIPCYRLDIDREIDLVEEVVRVHGLDRLPVDETLRIRVAPPQAAESARRAVQDALAGMGYVETITHSLIAQSAAEPFLPAGVNAMRVEDDRAGAESVLRPSLLPSLLRVRARNRDAGAQDLKLFESASTFAGSERRMIALLTDAAGAVDESVRALRGSIERVACILAGADARVEVDPGGAAAGWLEPAGVVTIDGERLGVIGVVAEAVRRRFDLEQPLVAAELELSRLYESYPPQTEARGQPEFPPIERDISAIVDEPITWQRVEEALRGAAGERLEAVEFVTTYRGKQIGAGRKSITARCRFRAADRTLTHEEVDGWMGPIEQAMSALGAEIRRS